MTTFFQLYLSALRQQKQSRGQKVDSHSPLLAANRRGAAPAPQSPLLLNPTLHDAKAARGPLRLDVARVEPGALPAWLREELLETANDNFARSAVTDRRS
ncbi:MAG: hypothetical protein AAF725_24845 [Acidobacteriota bacterium]